MKLRLRRLPLGTYACQIAGFYVSITPNVLWQTCKRHCNVPIVGGEQWQQMLKNTHKGGAVVQRIFVI